MIDSKNNNIDIADEVEGEDYILIDQKDFCVNEECGVIGIFSPEKKPLARDIYFGLFALQHRGQESAGIACSYNSDKIAYYKNMGLVSEVFKDEEIDLLPETNTAIGHVRYSTGGTSNVINAQPVVFFGKYGRMAVAHNGNIINARSIREKMIQEGHIFQSSRDVEVVAAIINDTGMQKPEDGIFEGCKQLEGAYAMVFLAAGKLIAIRDPRGFRPLVMGKKGNDIIFASESCALDAIDAKIIRDVEAGEMIVVDTDGSITTRTLPNVHKKPCIFEFVYLARSDSTMDGISVYDSRYESGKKMAELFKIDADIVSGVPDSAVVTARGYSVVSGLPYVDALSKNRYVGRTFIQPTQLQRESSVKVKLNAFKANIRGKRLILIDDSIVRGTTSKKIIQLLRASGAKEVHMLVASPIVKYPCYFGVDMDTRDQLIGGYRNAEEIREIIGADSLQYIPLEVLKNACGGRDYCTGCFSRDYSIDVSHLCETDALETRTCCDVEEYNPSLSAAHYDLLHNNSGVKRRYI